MSLHTMRSTVHQCCYCKKVKRFGEMIFMPTELEIAISKHDVCVSYFVCDACRSVKSTNLLLPVKDKEV